MKNKPMINVKLSEEIVNFLTMNCNMVQVGESRYFQPAQFWYKQIYQGDTTAFSVHRDLPNEKQQDKMINLLIKLESCQEAQKWAADKTWEEVYNTCERGDWLLWLFAKTNPDDLQLLTLAKGHIANTVRHLMKDDRSINAVDVAIAFGEGRATKDELSIASAAANAASYAANATASDAYAAYVASYAHSAAFAAYAAAYTDSSAAFAASDATNATTAFAASDATIYSDFAAYTDASAAFADYAAARKISLNQSADIVRKYIAIELWNVNNN